MAERLTLDIESSAVEVEITNDGESVGVIKMDPTDFDIIARAEKVSESLSTITVSEDDDIDTYNAISEKLKGEIDYLLNYKVSDVVFARCNPLSITKDGNFYVENVLNGLFKLIEQVTDKRISKKEAKIKKATAKYHTKDHLKASK